MRASSSTSLRVRVIASPTRQMRMRPRNSPGVSSSSETESTVCFAFDTYAVGVGVVHAEVVQNPVVIAGAAGGVAEHDAGRVVGVRRPVRGVAVAPNLRLLCLRRMTRFRSLSSRRKGALDAGQGSYRRTTCLKALRAAARALWCASPWPRLPLCARSKRAALVWSPSSFAAFLSSMKSASSCSSCVPEMACGELVLNRLVRALCCRFAMRMSVFFGLLLSRDISGSFRSRANERSVASRKQASSRHRSKARAKQAPQPPREWGVLLPVPGKEGQGPCWSRFVRGCLHHGEVVDESSRVCARSCSSLVRGFPASEALRGAAGLEE